MKKWIKGIIAFLGAALLLVSCGGQGGSSSSVSSDSAPSSHPAPVPIFASADEYPKVDGSTANLPLMAQVMADTCGISLEEAQSRTSNTGTNYAWSNLTEGYADLLLVYEAPEEMQKQVEESGVELEITPDATLSSAMSGSAGSSALSQLSGRSDDTEKDDGTFKLGDVAKVQETVSMNTISRDQQRRCVTVTATVADGYNVTHVTSAARQALGSAALPDGVTVEFNGENEQIMDAMGQLMLMLLLGVVLVYFIMVAQFQSLKSPFIVMFTIPLAFTGGFLALLVTGIEVSVISLIGFVMLVGIIVNNGIVLVDYINQQRLAGMERREAIIDAGVTRLRPILMTSLTTILGLIVTAAAKNAGTALMQPVAVVCIGGLLYATLMTLFVVPCMYEIMNRRDLRKVDERELEVVDT